VESQAGEVAEEENLGREVREVVAREAELNEFCQSSDAFRYVIELILTEEEGAEVG
jgi:hypothetical protein